MTPCQNGFLPLGWFATENALIFSGVEDHANSEEAKIARAEVLHCGKGDGGLGKNNGNASRGGEHVDHATEECA
jgi:hypothetical protein